MSEGPSFEDLIHHLHNNPDAGTRAEAARILGEYVDELNDEEYAHAHAAIQHALRDSDPTVLMTAMQSLSRFNRVQKKKVEEEPQDDTTPLVKVSTCSVCGRPEALVDINTCPHDNCPYK